MITGMCQCPQQCGRAASRHGPGEVVYSETCYKRWVKAGRPKEGAPKPKTPQETAQSRWPRVEPVLELDVEPDPDEIAARWGWVDPQLRQERAARALVDLVRCVQGAPDRQGTEMVMERFTDWGALAVLAAWCADPAKVAALAGTAGEGKAA